MGERIANIVLLVEDLNQENLLRRYLERLGHGNRNIRVKKSPKGRGAGEQFVRESYGAQVAAIRWQLTRTKACLIVMIDADTESVEDRQRQLLRALEDSGQDARHATDPILNLVPKRNVETWVLCLNAHEVDEIQTYRNDRRVDGAAIKTAAGSLFEVTRPNAQPRRLVLSLRASLPEFERLPA